MRAFIHKGLGHLRRQIIAHPYRWTVTVGLLSTGLLFVVSQSDRRAFVAKCQENKKTYEDCVCTYSALEDMPESYRKVAHAWAHKSRFEHHAASLAFGASEFGKALRNQVSSITEDSSAGPREAKSLWSTAKRGVTAFGRKVFGDVDLRYFVIVSEDASVVQTHTHVAVRRDNVAAFIQ